MKHTWSRTLLSNLRRTPQRRRDDATEIIRAFVHRLERLRALSRAQATAGAATVDKS